MNEQKRAYEENDVDNLLYRVELLLAYRAGVEAPIPETDDGDMLWATPTGDDMPLAILARGRMATPSTVLEAFAGICKVLRDYADELEEFGTQASLLRDSDGLKAPRRKRADKVAS